MTANLMIDSPVFGRYTCKCLSVVSTFLDPDAGPISGWFPRIILTWSRKMKIAVTLLVVALAGVSVFWQSPTLRVVTDDPNLPSELFYGSVKVKPLRVRPGTNSTADDHDCDTDFFVQQQYVDFPIACPIRVASVSGTATSPSAARTQPASTSRA